MKLPKMSEQEFVSKMWNRRMDKIANLQEGIVTGIETEMRSDVEMYERDTFNRGQLPPIRGRTRTVLTIEICDGEVPYLIGKKIEIREVEE
jgi:hypothetical protein